MLVLLGAGFGMDGRDGALAVALGCGVAILPNAYFTIQAFRYKASEQPVKALNAIYRGETGKIVLVMVFCALVFRFVELQNPLLLFVALIVMLMTQILISLRVFPALRAPENPNELNATKQEID